MVTVKEIGLEEQIQKSAEKYAKKHEKIINYHHDEPETDFEGKKNAYIEGAQSILPKIKELTRTSNKWIKCSGQLPKKVDGRIRSNVVLVSITGDDWTVAEYHFGDKQWINLLGEIKVIEPKYWQEVNLPEEVLEKRK